MALVEVDDGAVTVLERASSENPRRHAESLAPMMAAQLEAHGAELDAVAAGTGPGPFTGLRAGLVTARVFARGRDIPVYGVCSLDVLARQAFDLGATGEVLVATDARRREVYWARYRALGEHDVERLAGPEVSTPADVAAAHSDFVVPGGGVIVGSGAALYPEVLPPRWPGAGPEAVRAVDAAVLAQLVAARLRAEAAGAEVDLSLEPRYLRRPDAIARSS